MTGGVLLCEMLLAFEMLVLVVLMKLCIKEVVNKGPLMRAYSMNSTLGVGFCSVSTPSSNNRRTVSLLGDIILQIRY